MSGIKTEILTSLARVGRDDWNADFKPCIHLDYDNLRVIEESRINDIGNLYLRFHENGDLGRANLYLVRTDLSTMDAHLKGAGRIIKKWYPDFMKLKTLECGSFTGISEGTIVKDESRRPEVLRRLAEEMDSLAREYDADIQIVRDVPLARYKTYRDALSPFGYYPTPGFPDADITIRWNSAEEYLDDLKKNRRTTLRHYLKSLKDEYDIDYEFTNDFRELAPVMAALWKNVHGAAADYQREFLDENYFASAALRLKDHGEVLLFRKNGKIISFALSLFDDEKYYAENLGSDYAIADFKNVNLYNLGLLFRIERAVALNKKILNLGITTYLPKLDMGATIVPLVYFVKHAKNKSYSKTVAKLLYDNIKHPDTQAYKPFKEYDANTLDYPRYLLDIKKDWNDLPEDDIFCKVSKYQRTNGAKLSGLYNFYPEFKSAQESCIKMENNDRVVLLGTNSYLGAATLPEVKEAAKRAIDKYGTGCSGSPLLNGTLDLHAALERELAAFLDREAVVLCSTGYQTNLAGISALAEAGDNIVMDERSHRSLFDAARLSGANYFIYRHNDVGHLESLLARLGDRKKLIVSDSVFSMEGRIADLVSICALAKKYRARTFIDEAHAVGVFGERGRGVCELLGVEREVDLVMGTFSKSFASIGGYIAGKKDVIDFIKHTAGPHIFSASLPPASIAAVSAVIKVIRERPGLRAEILAKARHMADELTAMGYHAPFRGTQIVPVIFGNETLAMAAYKRFMESGVYVNPVLPPAVPESDAGFRTSYMAAHRWEDLEYALSIFRKHAPDFK